MLAYYRVPTCKVVYATYPHNNGENHSLHANMWLRDRCYGNAECGTEVLGTLRTSLHKRSDIAGTGAFGLKVCPGKFPTGEPVYNT